MKHLKYFESELSDIRAENKNNFKKKSPEYLPEFKGGTINPDDDEPYDWGDFNAGNIHRIESEKQIYERFLIAIKKEYFTETEDQIIIDLEGLDGTFCISIQNYSRHITKFLNDELVGKYISDGFIDYWKDEDSQLEEYNLSGIIQKIYIEHEDSFNCGSIFNIILRDKPTDTEHTLCREIIKIDKLKSLANIYNL